jgi:ABC-2 type transport system ATP-binding protein
MSAPWIEVEDLFLSRGGRLVLQGIRASLGGRAIGLVGANGAGKSTLIGALLGVLRGDRGSIRVLGLEVPRRAREVRTRAGVMAEQAGVFPGGSGVEAVAFAGALSGLARREALRRAHRALDALDVGEERYRPTRGYSTGMRQRCKLAMALVHDPEILILDEPTVGLDPAGRNQLLALVRELRDEGRRVLLSTHVLPDAESVCDQVLLLEGGAVGYSGSLTELVRPRSTRWIAEGTGLDAAFAAVLNAAGVQAAADASGRVSFEGADTALGEFWRLAANAGAEVRRLDRDSSTFEDAVLERMSGARPA